MGISLLQDYLRNNPIQKLNKDYGIDIKYHSKYPNLVLLKYNQIATPRDHPLGNLCRGVILDSTNNWKPVCYSFQRFWNYGEQCSPEIDWKSAIVFEKVDGSLMRLFYYNNEWLVASSGTPDASGEAHGSKHLTFEILFWSVFTDLKYKIPENTNLCYSFELMTEYNRVVVPHEKPRLVLHGARDLSTLKELKYSELSNIAKQNNWELIKKYDLNSWNNVMELTATLDPLEQEGFVVCNEVGDENFRRVKVKSPQYVELSHLKEAGNSQRNLLEIIRKNESAEFLVYFKYLEEEYNKLLKKYEIIVETIKNDYEQVKMIEVQKEFALQVKDNKYNGVLFALRNGKTSSIKLYLVDMNIKKLEEWVDGIK